MKTHSLGSGLVMFIAGLMLIVEILAILTFEGTKYPISSFVLFIIFLFFFGRACFRFGHYKPDTLEQGRIYTFRGYDSQTNILFLIEHIHLEIPVQQPESSVSVLGIDVTHTQPSTEFEDVDFEEASLYRGEIFTQDLNIGELVIATVEEGPENEEILGIKRYEKAA